MRWGCRDIETPRDDNMHTSSLRPQPTLPITTRWRRIQTPIPAPESIPVIERLRNLERLSEDAGFRTRWSEVKRANKAELAEFVRRSTGVSVDPDSMFDVQVKRIHEYKRQHLAILHVIGLYQRLI